MHGCFAPWMRVDFFQAPTLRFGARIDPFEPAKPACRFSGSESMCFGTDKFDVALLFTTGNEPQHRVEDEHRSASNRDVKRDDHVRLAEIHRPARRPRRAMGSCEHGRLRPALEDERPERKRREACQHTPRLRT